MLLIDSMGAVRDQICSFGTESRMLEERTTVFSKP